MAKKVIWTKTAIQSKVEILEYWYLKTGNKNYSKKLDLIFKNTITAIKYFPKIGRKIENRSERYFVRNDYQIFYTEKAETIFILLIWDSRRAPDELSIENIIL